MFCCRFICLPASQPANRLSNFLQAIACASEPSWFDCMWRVIVCLIALGLSLSVSVRFCSYGFRYWLFFFLLISFQACQFAWNSLTYKVYHLCWHTLSLLDVQYINAMFTFKLEQNAPLNGSIISMVFCYYCDNFYYGNT